MKTFKEHFNDLHPDDKAIIRAFNGDDIISKEDSAEIYDDHSAELCAIIGCTEDVYPYKHRIVLLALEKLALEVSA